ncbi:MAG: Trx7/PDZ domain-containing (seleno)protein, partial [Planctomycetaceae bacterium]
QERKTREELVREDRTTIESSDFWIYNDVEAGFREAKRSGKPLLVTFRCVPCEHCAQLDEEVAERDPLIGSLLDEFVCVRVVHANGMDLSLFQFDYDQSWAAFLMNGDRAIYGRYGTRSHPRESHNDVSLEGFAKALQAALELHKQYPQNKAALAGKHGPKAEYAAPEEMPSLKGKYGSELDYEGKVVQSCIHCHQVLQAQRVHYRLADEPVPAKVLFPYPHPKSLGLIMDPQEKATVKEVVEGSPAAEDGFRAGDELLTLSGQPLLSIADIQWVLHNTGETARLTAEVRRNGETIELPITLEEGWRQRGDISWRASSWELRRIATGGMKLNDLSEAERRRAGLAENDLALRAEHVGQYGEHAAAKRAGFQKGDVLTAIDGQSGRMSESDLFAYVLNRKETGERIAVTVLRDGRRIELTLPVQK